MKSYTITTLKDFFSHVFRYKYLTSLVLVSLFIEFTLRIITPILYKFFFDLLASGKSQDEIVAGLFDILIALATLFAVSWVFIRISQFAYNRLRTRVMYDISNKCFAYLHRHSFDYFNSEFIGSLVKRVQWYVKAFEVVMDRIIWNIFALLINIVVILVVLLFINPYLSLVIFIWLVIFTGFNAIVVKYKIKYDIQRSLAATATTAVLADTITNHSNVKLFNGYQRALARFSKASDKLRHLRLFTSDISAWVDAVQSLLMFGLEILLLFFSVKLWQQGLITIGDFFLIQAYIITIFYRIWDFGKIIRDIYESLADAAEMTEILETPHEIQDIPKAKKLKVDQGEIEFKDVVFDYPKGSSVMEKFNLQIPAGERLALIGPSGAGKTTVVKLLLRMYDIQGGHILIDGQDISKVTQESLWGNISLVPQDPILFHASLIENIRYGKPGATDEEVIKAAKAAHCHEFIVGLVDGYDTYVGERGIKLSGGERQRVAIARAILRNAPILILDEATSSLDSESEGFIQDALDNLMKDKTVIVIAHRLSTIKKMDRIVVIDGGQVIEEGSHRGLTQLSKGLYRKLWELQAGGFS